MRNSVQILFHSGRLRVFTILITALSGAGCSEPGDPPNVTDLQPVPTTQDTVALKQQVPEQPLEEQVLEEQLLEWINAYAVTADDSVQLPDTAGSSEVTMEVSGSNGSLSWTPDTEASYEQVDMTIASGQGEQIRRTFAAGEQMMVTDDLPDGSYAWESRATPYVDPAVREEMRAVRMSGNLAEERQLLTRLREQGYLPTEQEIARDSHSGHFTIKDGVVVTGDIEKSARWTVVQPANEGQQERFRGALDRDR